MGKITLEHNKNYFNFHDLPDFCCFVEKDMVDSLSVNEAGFYKKSCNEYYFIEFAIDGNLNICKMTEDDFVTTDRFVLLEVTSINLKVVS